MLHPAAQELVSLCRLQGAEARQASANQQAANACIEEIKDESQLAVEGGVNHLGNRRLRGGGTCGTTTSDEPLRQGGEGLSLGLAKDAHRRRRRRRGR